jgi:non-heme chloroperoxidase
MLRDLGPGTRVRGGGGVELSVLEGGNRSGTPILFIHGYLQSAACWCKQLESDLAGDFRLIAFDLRGHGASEKPLRSEAYSDSKLWADDVAAVLAQLDVRRALIVGWSYAGYVIADYLRFYGQERIGALAFVSAVTRRGDEKVRNFADPRFAQLFPALFSEDAHVYGAALEAMTDLLVADRDRLDASTRAEIIEGAARIPAIAREGMQRRKVENDDVLAAITVPVLCVHGAQDAVVLPASSVHNASMIPAAELTFYESVGHSAFFEDPARFNRDLRMLAQQVE